MSRISKTVAALVTALACAVLGYAPSAQAQTVPQTLTQQGRLLDSAGTPVDGVQLTFTFTLYTAASGGTGIWTENQDITPDQGYFSAKLGDVTAFTPTIFDGSQGALFLGIKIGSDAEMAPRQALTSVPFALLALNSLSATHAATATNADHAAVADLATKATTATSATSATSATTATTATNANHATIADTVTAIAGNFSVKDAAFQTGTATLACDAGTVIVGGFCYPTTGTVAATGLASSNQSTSITTKSYTCTCAGTGCGLNASIICAK